MLYDGIPVSLHCAVLFQAALEIRALHSTSQILLIYCYFVDCVIEY